MASLGLSPRKAWGQHFLISPGVLDSIVQAAQLSPGDLVVEVGPGLGILTEVLTRQGARVVAVEIDPGLVTALRARFQELPSVQILQGDARQIEPLEVTGGKLYKVVANLPYYAASPIVRRFLEGSHRPSLMVVTVQREVAQNMAAAPPRMNLMGLGVQFYGHPKIVRYINAGSFYPPPKVTSAVVRIEVYPEPPWKIADVPRFFSLLRGGFSAPRKQLKGALSRALGLPAPSMAEVLLRAGIDPTRRAETLGLPEWANLYRVWLEQHE